MKLVPISAMVLLMIAALFWGNCFSCPQMLLASPGHDCCPDKHPADQKCTTQGMQHFVKALAAHVSVIPVVLAKIEPPVPAPIHEAPVATAVPVEHAPPGLTVIRI